MIDSSEFPAIPYQQSSEECIPASFGTASFPFARVEVPEIVLAAVVCWPSESSSGYDLMEQVFNRCNEPAFVAVRERIRLERQHGLAGLDDTLTTERTSAIVALTFPHAGKPHSVCVAYDGTSFILRDSAGSGALGSSLVELLTSGSSGGIPGDVIVLREPHKRRDDEES